MYERALPLTVLIAPVLVFAVNTLPLIVDVVALAAVAKA
jgi:hypothetical protein